MMSYAPTVRATEPLMPPPLQRVSVDQFFDEITAVLQLEYSAYHLDCWERYKKRKSLPPNWRGHKDVYQYDRLMADLVSISTSPSGLRRVRLAAFLRAHIRKNGKTGIRDVEQVMHWFRNLTPTQRQVFAELRRDEEAQRKRDERLIAKLNAMYPKYAGSDVFDDAVEKFKRQRSRNRK
jgi:hypothetical protein